MRERNWLCGLRFITEKAAQLLGVCCRKKRSDFMRFLPRTETGGGKIPIKKAVSWGQEKINIFLSWT